MAGIPVNKLSSVPAPRESSGNAGCFERIPFPPQTKLSERDARRKIRLRGPRREWKGDARSSDRLVRLTNECVNERQIARIGRHEMRFDFLARVRPYGLSEIRRAQSAPDQPGAGDSRATRQCVTDKQSHGVALQSARTGSPSCWLPGAFRRKIRPQKCLHAEAPAKISIQMITLPRVSCLWG